MGLVVMKTLFKKESTYLISKIVLAGFIAAWFLAASPIKRSSGVKETNDGVV
jgi:hypothetical protein